MSLAQNDCVKVWGRDGDELLAVLQADDLKLRAVAVSADGEYVLTTGEHSGIGVGCREPNSSQSDDDGILALWSVRQQAILWHFHAPVALSSLAIKDDGTVAVGTNACAIIVWNLPRMLQNASQPETQLDWIYCCGRPHRFRRGVVIRGRCR